MPKGLNRLGNPGADRGEDFSPESDSKTAKMLVVLYSEELEKSIKTISEDIDSTHPDWQKCQAVKVEVMHLLLKARNEMKSPAFLDKIVCLS